MKTKQYTFHHPAEVTHVYPDGRTERVRYGHFEAIEFTHENGLEFKGTITLAIPTIPVMEMTKVDGTKVVADEGKPFYYINRRNNDD